MGPFDFSTNHECGAARRGLRPKPQILEFWHHPYYQGLFESAGLSKAMDLYKWFLDVSDREKILPVIFELADKVESEHGILVRRMRKKDFEAEVRRFMEVYNSAWENNWAFVPLTDTELRDYAKQLSRCSTSAGLDRREGRRDRRRGVDAARLERGPDRHGRAACSRPAGSSS